jgi:hypothetical protein
VGFVTARWPDSVFVRLAAGRVDELFLAIVAGLVVELLMLWIRGGDER